MSTQLDEATERLNQTLRRAEATFAALKLGVSASVPLRQDGQWNVVLRFTKDANEWRPMVVNSIGPQSTDTPLLSASRETRLCALSKLPELYQAMLAAVDKQAASIELELSRAEAFLDSLT